MRQKLVAGNWKMHGNLGQNRSLLEAVGRGVDKFPEVCCAVLVPYPYLAQIQESLQSTRLQWGAQNVSEHASGAYTGEVSAQMLRDFGCQFAIVGHSERRALYGEDSDTVARKFKAARADGLTPILCVGESLSERESDLTEDVVGAQLDSVLKDCGVAALAEAVVAYEPVWAIGTGKTASPAQAQAVHAFIRNRIAGEDNAIAAELKIVYGGSVKAANAKELFAMPDIDGGLIGGASLA
ncbi:MAG: triose-phosphate isomerase, partial [Burkholderiales bacterium]|nr:triose-phosphate isomerase [Burkholderiales bacterium]